MSETVHVEIALQSKTHCLAIACLLRGIEDDDVKALTGRQNIAQPGKQVGLNEADPRLIQVGVLLRQIESVFVEIDRYHFVSVSQDLGMHRETPRVATKVQNATAGAKSGESLAGVA